MEREITIDASGRLVIPKDVRLRHRLAAGARLTLVDDDERLILIPRQQTTSTVEKAGLLVFQGRLDGETPDHHVMREERLARLAGE